MLSITAGLDRKRMHRATVESELASSSPRLCANCPANRTGLIDPDGNRSTFAYDALNRLVSDTDALNHTKTYAYDAASELTSQTDRLGRRIDFAYDAAGELLTEKWYDASGTFVQTNTYAYDPSGNRTLAAAPTGTTTTAYDALDRVSVVQGPFELTVTYTYDADGNRWVVQDSLGGVTTSTYDAADRLAERQFGGAGQTPLKWDLWYTDTNLEQTEYRYRWDTGLGVFVLMSETDSTYDPAGRLTNLKHKDGLGNVLQNTTYSYDTADRVTAQTIDGVTTSYSYDADNQLTADGATAYSYDADGNRTMTGYVTGTNNQLTSDGTWAYTYDADGNMVKKSKGASAETWTYGYDNHDRLVWAEDRATDGGTLLVRVEYAYDALGDRVSRVVKDGSLVVTETDRFGYDGQNVWADLDGSNALVTRRLYGDRVDEVAARVSAGGTAAWYLADRLGSVTRVIDSTGSVIDTIAYDAWGNVASESSPSSGDRYKFTGREQDSVTGLQYNRGRYYGPGIGRWGSEDPTGFAAGDADLYRYVENDPTDGTDPSGTVRAFVHLDYEGVASNGGQLPDKDKHGGVRQGRNMAYYWPIRWVMKSADVGPSGGVIIQKVKFSYDIFDQASPFVFD